MSALRAYLDYNATAPLRTVARDAMCEAMASVGNPSSIHADGRAARRLIECARADVAALAGVPAEAVIFTSGGTEANATALLGWDGPVAVSAVEHDAVRLVRHDAAILPVDVQGLTDPASLETLPAGTLVSVMSANNETGAIQPLAEIGDAVARSGLVWHSDCAQTFGRMAVNPLEHGAHAISVSAHKIGGPKGVGALILRDDAFRFTPLLRGGGQERHRRGGTENVAAIAGFGAAAAEIAGAGYGGLEMRTLRDWIESSIVSISPTAVIAAQSTERLPNTICVAVPGVDAQTLLIAFDLAGLSLSAGAACSSGKVAPSHVLLAMGWSEALARGAVRISFGPETARAEAERLVVAWREIVLPLAANQTAGLAA